MDTCKSSVKTTLTNDYTSYDDDFFTINLPFPVTFYGQTTRTLYMSVNGVGLAEDVVSSKPKIN